MAFVAKLYHDIRAAERYPVVLDGTLRNARAEPQDVVIDDLSATGFRTTTASNVTVGEDITLGVFGVGLRAARVLRETDTGYGCQFLVPLTADELATALSGLTPPEPVRLDVGLRTAADPDGAEQDIGEPWSLSPRGRVLAIATIAIVPWLLLGIGWLSIA